METLGEIGTYRLSWWQFAGLQFRSMNPQVMLMALLQLGMLSVLISLPLTEEFAADTSELLVIGLMIALILAFLVALWWGSFVHPYALMEMDRELTLISEPDQLVVQGVHARREYPRHGTKFRRVGRYTRIRIGRQFMSDFVPCTLLSVEGFQKWTEASLKAEPVAEEGQFEICANAASYTADWWRMMTSLRAAIGFAAASVFVALTLWISAVTNLFLFPFGVGIMAGISMIVLQPAASWLAIRALPFRNVQADIVDDGLQIHYQGYREVVPWRGIRSVFVESDRLQMRLGFCPVNLRPLAHVDHDAIKRLVATIPAVKVRLTRRGWRTRAVSIASWIVASAAMVFIVFSHERPQWIADDGYTQWQLEDLSGVAGWALVAGAVMLFVFQGLLAFLALFNRRGA